MTDSEPQFIVRTADGKKSKPVSKARILEMHSAGKIGDGATVTRVGTNYAIAIQEFVSAGGKRAKVKPELIPDPFENQPPFSPPVLPLAPVSPPSLDESSARPPIIPADADSNDGNVFRPPQSRPVKVAVGRGGSPVDSLVNGITAIVTWPIRGFLIPSRGVDETRDYLRSTIGWLEGWLRFIHLLTVIFLGVLGYMYFRFVQESRMNPRLDGWDVAIRGLYSLSTYLWTFFVLMLIQAVLRLVPASLRYWIEATEEARKT